MARGRNLARMTTVTTGTGTVTLGSAVSGSNSFAGAGFADGETVTYSIFDITNSASETGRGTYTSSGTTLSRDTVESSTNGGSKISLSGNAEVAAVMSAKDFEIETNAQTGTSYTVLQSDFAKLITLTNASAIAVTLPQATSKFSAGWYCRMRNVGSSVVTITPTTSTINGASTLTLNANDWVIVVSDGTNWQVFGQYTSVKIAAAGAVGAPAFTTTGDTDTGIWFPAANTVAGSTGGSERFRVDSFGNFYVGTTSLAAKFGVQSADVVANIFCVGTTYGVRVIPLTTEIRVQSVNAAQSAYGPFQIDGSTLSFNPNTGGGCYFPSASTTASAANAFLNSGSTPANELLRSTSSIRYKKDVETLDNAYAERLLGARPIWYRSKCAADDPSKSYYGLLAEELAEIDPRLVQYGYAAESWETVETDGIESRRLKDNAELVPDGVGYERLTVLLLALTQRLWSKTVAPTSGSGLSGTKAWLQRMVDDDAEAIRIKYMTPGSAQATIYREKFEQATAVSAMGQSAANAMSEQDRISTFPTLAASVGIEAASLWDCAQLVLSKFSQFAQLSYVIERTRLAGKKSIGDASDEAAAKAAYEAIQWTV